MTSIIRRRAFLAIDEMDFLDQFDAAFGRISDEETENDEFLDDESQSGEEEEVQQEDPRNYRQYPIYYIIDLPDILYHSIDFLEHWSENEFKKRFRLNKATIAYVLSLIADQLEPSVAFKNR